MRRAEASVRETEGLEAGLLVKDFYGKSVDDVLKRFAGEGGAVATLDEARAAMRRARGGAVGATAAAADGDGGGGGGDGGATGGR